MKFDSKQTKEICLKLPVAPQLTEISETYLKLVKIGK